MSMTHKERARAALECRIPDRVPTFELEFQLAEEMFGKPLVARKWRLRSAPDSPRGNGSV